MVRNFIVPNSLVEPRTFRKSAGDGDRTYTGDVNPLPKTVGGGAIHADMKTPRFVPTDFELGTRLGEIAGADFADWPVGYDELEPFYSYVEGALGVQGLAATEPVGRPAERALSDAARAFRCMPGFSSTTARRAWATIRSPIRPRSTPGPTAEGPRASTAVTAAVTVARSPPRARPRSRCCAQRS